MRSKKNFKRFVCTILCLCLTMGTLLTFTSCNNGEGEVTEDPNANKATVVRAIKTIEAGTKLRKSDFEEVMIDKDQIPEGAFSSVDDITNKFATVNLYSGDIIFQDKVSRIALTGQLGEELHEDFVVITEYIEPGETDVSASIQRAVDENPNKTIYFPDGSYVVSKPIKTSADPEKCVSFRLSTYAHIAVASSKWEKGAEAVFELGAIDSSENGSCYLVGGIIGGAGVAAGISVVGGTAYINNFSIKQTPTGIIIKDGAYADVDSGVIAGAGGKTTTYEGAVGILMEGNNSTLTNLRISSVDIGIKITGENNTLRNVHPLYVGKVHDDSVGFWDTGSGNFYDMCYSDQFAVAYRLSGDTYSVYNSCFAFWYTNESRQYGFVVDGKFNSVIRDTQVNLLYGSDTSANPDGKSDEDCTFISISEEGGCGAIIFPRISNPHNDDHREGYAAYLKTDIIN